MFDYAADFKRLQQQTTDLTKDQKDMFEERIYKKDNKDVPHADAFFNDEHKRLDQSECPVPGSQEPRLHQFVSTSPGGDPYMHKPFLPRDY